MKKITLLLLGLVLSIRFGISQTQSPDYGDLIKEYRNLLTSEIAKNNIAGLSIALVDKNGIIWSEGFGYDNIKDSIKATENSIYCIGSITKLFTGTAIMQLAESKKIDIDKPVTTYIPELKIKSLYGSIDSITTRLIMTHNSGFPSDLMGLSSGHESHKNVVQYLNKQYTAFAPKYARIYSNLGYCFLGYEIEKVSNTDYSDYITRNIFGPLGMKDSFISNENASLKNVSRTYDYQKNQKNEEWFMELPAGGIYSSVKDMSAFIRSWLQEKSPLLKTETVNSIFEPQKPNLSFNLGSEYGLGWDLRKTKFNFIAEHGGATLYYRAQIAINRYAGLGVIILSNSANAGAVTWRASEIIDKACVIKGIAESGVPEFKTESILHRHLNLSEYAGYYGQNMSWYPLIVKGNGLTGLPGNDSMAFKPEDSGYFSLAVKQGEKWLNIPGQQFIFTELQGEKVFLAQAWGTWTIAAKMYPTQNISELWKTRLGKYKVINYNNSCMFSEAELMITENTLCISARTPYSDQPMFMPFEIRSESLASVLGTATYSGSMLQILNKNGVETLYFMGLELEKI
jgi:CubicO group peptidase (beta-lactamase class C family)